MGKIRRSFGKVKRLFTRDKTRPVPESDNQSLFERRRGRSPRRQHDSSAGEESKTTGRLLEPLGPWHDSGVGLPSETDSQGRSEGSSKPHFDDGRDGNGRAELAETYGALVERLRDTYGNTIRESQELSDVEKERRAREPDQERQAERPTRRMTTSDATSPEEQQRKYNSRSQEQLHKMLVAKSERARHVHTRLKYRGGGSRADDHNFL
jgi:hypothetical protein